MDRNGWLNLSEVLERAQYCVDIGKGAHLNSEGQGEPDYDEEDFVTAMDTVQSEGQEMESNQGSVAQEPDEVSDLKYRISRLQDSDWEDDDKVEAETFDLRPRGLLHENCTVDYATELVVDRKRSWENPGSPKPDFRFLGQCQVKLECADKIP